MYLPILLHTAVYTEDEKEERRRRKMEDVAATDGLPEDFDEMQLYS